MPDQTRPGTGSRLIVQWLLLLVSLIALAAALTLWVVGNISPDTVSAAWLAVRGVSSSQDDLVTQVERLETSMPAGFRLVETMTCLPLAT